MSRNNCGKWKTENGKRKSEEGRNAETLRAQRNAHKSKDPHSLKAEGGTFGMHAAHEFRIVITRCAEILRFAQDDKFKWIAVFVLIWVRLRLNPHPLKAEGGAPKSRKSGTKRVMTVWAPDPRG